MSQVSLIFIHRFVFYEETYINYIPFYGALYGVYKTCIKHLVSAFETDLTHNDRRKSVYGLTPSSTHRVHSVRHEDK